MRYSVNLRMKNPGPAKYLIDARETDNMVKAFEIATAVMTNINDDEHFVEIVDMQTGESIANFNEDQAP